MLEFTHHLTIAPTHPIILLTGAVHTGKSTALVAWCEAQKRSGLAVRGLLNPVADSQKQFVDAHTGETVAMEAATDETEVIEVGKYRFSARAFARARGIIAQSSAQQSDILVIDEIGKLELAGRGLEPEISRLMAQGPALRTRQLVLVVRDYLLEQAIAHYAIPNPRVVRSLPLNS